MHRFVFVGTGVSSGIPVIGHPVDPQKPCACAKAIDDPVRDPNYRNNVSLMVVAPPSTTNGAAVATDFGRDYVLIDCGKTFRDAYFRTIRPRQLGDLISVLFTHEHADAINGVDDLRDFQRYEYLDPTAGGGVASGEGNYYRIQRPMFAYMGSTTQKTLWKSVEYVMRQSVFLGTAEHGVATNVAALPPVDIPRRSLVLGVFDVDENRVMRLAVAGLEDVRVWSVPLYHGGTYIALGFVFGGTLRHEEVDDGSQCVVYLSDVHLIPDATMAFLKALWRIDVLIVDCLLGPGEKHFSHFCMDDVWRTTVELKPVTVWGVGMYCSLEHEATNDALHLELARRRAVDVDSVATVRSVACARDGQHFDARVRPGAL